jgi:hypothetical protein
VFSKRIKNFDHKFCIYKIIKNLKNKVYLVYPKLIDGQSLALGDVTHKILLIDLRI